MVLREHMGDNMLAGIDIVGIQRFKQVAERTPRILNRLFTEGEFEYCKRRRNPFPSLAVRFAAKEAVKKLELGLQEGVSFRDIEVVNDPSGIPRVVLHGRAAQYWENAAYGSIALSLSHTDDHAVAVAVARKGE
ncbi:MAG TPA: holo-ACP synthase [Syntrophomonadaceae bacterium]|nr:holo-ACP synthase [Syntrophomonadaceae bacterium]